MKRLALAALFALSTSAFAADTWEIDGGHSRVTFRITHFGASPFYGQFPGVSGTMVLDDADPTKSTINISVAVDSVDTFNEKRDAHLKGADFFNAAQFPTMTFKSTKVAKKSDKVLTVTGDLTLHGVTKSVTVDFERIGTGKDPWGGTRTGGEAIFTIKRSDFGITYMPDGLGDEVKLIVAVEGVKK